MSLLCSKSIHLRCISLDALAANDEWSSSVGAGPGPVSMLPRSLYENPLAVRQGENQGSRARFPWSTGGGASRESNPNENPSSTRSDQDDEFQQGGRPRAPRPSGDAFAELVGLGALTARATDGRGRGKGDLQLLPREVLLAALQLGLEAPSQGVPSRQATA